MNIEIIGNQFETRAGTLLRYYTGLLESSRERPFSFKIYNDPFDIVYVVMNGILYGHVYIEDCKVRKSFEIASPKHTEGLIRSIEGNYVGYELYDGETLTTLSISDMMASNLFKDEYFMYGLQTFAEANNSDVFEYMENGFDADTVEGIQSSNADVIGNIEMLYQLATGINEPAPELVEGLKLVTDFVQDENATQDDYKALERKLSELKASYYSVSK
ncbi:pathogenicity island protein [Staphylococcus pasteuri]|uniref:pathogenicity island protein n=1 Tax=Staphylococcus pasteuri TaxID=45972 RepID=UPI003CFDA2B2